MIHKWIQQLFKKQEQKEIPKSLFVPKPKEGRRLVIPDIHGCYRTLEVLLERIQLTKADQLFFLGDYISRGESSAKVLDMIMDLQKNGFQVYALRGNHEDMLLDCVKNRPYELSWLNNKLHFDDLLTSKKELKAKYLGFLNSLYYYIELDDFFLAHAGFDFSKLDPFEDYESMLWIREFTYDARKAKGKRIVHGHTTKPLIVIREALVNGVEVIPLDNGCVYLNEKPQRGHLLCLDLDSEELVMEKRVMPFL